MAAFQPQTPQQAISHLCSITKDRQVELQEDINFLCEELEPEDMSHQKILDPATTPEDVLRFHELIFERNCLVEIVAMLDVKFYEGRITNAVRNWTNSGDDRALDMAIIEIVNFVKYHENWGLGGCGHPFVNVWEQLFLIFPWLREFIGEEMGGLKVIVKEDGQVAVKVVDQDGNILETDDEDEDDNGCEDEDDSDDEDSEEDSDEEDDDDGEEEEEEEDDEEDDDESDEEDDFDECQGKTARGWIL